MKRFEYALCGLLMLSAIGHFIGTFTGYQIGTEVFVWSLSATAFAIAVVFLNILRIQRPDDRPIRWGAVGFALAWAVLALMFGASQGSFFDPRALTHAALSLALAVTGAFRSA